MIQTLIQSTTDDGRFYSYSSEDPPPILANDVVHLVLPLQVVVSKQSLMYSV